MKDNLDWQLIELILDKLRTIKSSIPLKELPRLTSRYDHNARGRTRSSPRLFTISSRLVHNRDFQHGQFTIVMISLRLVHD